MHGFLVFFVCVFVFFGHTSPPRLLLRVWMHACHVASGEELISAMSSELTAMSFAPGQEIVALDAPLLGTYIIKSGSVLGSMDRTLETGDFFGVSDYRGDAPVRRACS